MDWIQISAEAQKQIPQIIQSIKINQFQKFTIFDHNYTSKFDQEELSFECVLNCKRLNSLYSTICKIEGDLKHSIIKISCSLLNNLLVVGGKWHQQRIQLLRFAMKYNQRSNNNISVHANPINGQMCVCTNFMISPLIFQQPDKLRLIITEQVKILGQQAQKIFNTIIQVIFYQETDQPYMKSSKASATFFPHIKVQKLLDKLKPLIATSTHYQIIKQISKGHRNRSFFKKIYLQNKMKYIPNSAINQYARAYTVKFHEKYEEYSNQNALKEKQFIKRYQQIQQKYEIQFAKHLKIQELSERGVIQNLNIKGKQENKVNFNDSVLILNNNVKHQFNVQQVQDSKDLQYQFNLLNFISGKHPNIVQYYKCNQYNKLRITESRTIPVQQYLRRNKEVTGLSTKLSFMSQLCHVIHFLNYSQILYFVKMNNIVIGNNLVLKVKNFIKSTVIQKLEGQSREQIKVNRQIPNQLRSHFKGYLPSSSKQNADRVNLKQFPYINLSGWKNDLKREKINMYSLGVVLYKILFQKFPFYEGIQQDELAQIDWQKLWVIQTESFLQYGGQITKLLASLLLKCFNLKNKEIVQQARPYIEWLMVIISEIKFSEEGIF